MIINYYLITIAQDNSYESDLQILFGKYRNIDKTKMGFPSDWTHFSITFMDKSLRLETLPRKM